ncbi:MAG: hypothetical protein ACLGH8_06325 [Bacteroidia bacterium]
MNEAFWLTLLIEKSKEGTGLTIPFLIGSQYLLKFDSVIQLRELVDQMVVSHVPIIIKHCFQTKEYICTVNKELAHGYYKNVKKVGNLTIIADNGFLVGIDQYDHIIETLELFYNKHILAGKYSRIVNHTEEKWGYYSPKEETFIKRVLD